jgi:hypothetical protein
MEPVLALQNGRYAALYMLVGCTRLRGKRVELNLCGILNKKTYTGAKSTHHQTISSIPPAEVCDEILEGTARSRSRPRASTRPQEATSLLYVSHLLAGFHCP